MAEEASSNKGRSKSAIDARRGNQFFVNPDDLVIVGLDTAHEAGGHPLYTVVEAARLAEDLDDDMLAGIQKLGIVVPITAIKAPIRLRGESPDGPPEERVIVVAGRRRVRHAREINKINLHRGLPIIEVPVVLRPSKDMATAQVAAIVENEHRDGTSVLAKALTTLDLLNSGVPEEEVCMIFRLSDRTFRQYKALGAAPPEVKALFSAGKVTLVGMEEIAKYPYEEQLTVAQRLAEAHGGIVGKKAVQAERHGEGSGSDSGSGAGSGSGGTGIVRRGVPAPVLARTVARLPPGLSPEADLFRETLAWVASGNPSSRIQAILDQQVDPDKGKADKTQQAKGGKAPEAGKGKGKGKKSEATATTVPASVVAPPAGDDLPWGAEAPDPAEVPSNSQTFTLSEADLASADPATESPAEDSGESLADLAEAVADLAEASEATVATVATEIPAAAPAPVLSAADLLAQLGQGMMSAIDAQ